MYYIKAPEPPTIFLNPDNTLLISQDYTLPIVEGTPSDNLLEVIETYFTTVDALPISDDMKQFHKNTFNSRLDMVGEEASLAAANRMYRELLEYNIPLIAYSTAEINLN